MKLFILSVVLYGLAGCNIWNFAQGPVIPFEGIYENGIHLTVEQPETGCLFKGWIDGATNPQSEGKYFSLLTLDQMMRDALSDSALDMGGNTVWLQNTDWENPEESTYYYKPFVINNVEYRASVYKCP